ncbi:hypothetical protein HYH03_007331 [Edaphochlamys debaryana]|uniref:Uncharacterized protein n=1 Tax=Edaphochlamys debaryana TaxID=47281 RepID=A0A835Y278_9CHLO|nr:hypothetical protein HYH03_007331 [Edaphochlamys debaryana]|eukprot:KAG2494565.1 hypothetical protein HYH03_007331 [Edaphochlamys debaryana]
MFASCLHELAYWVDPAWVSGTIPPELCGTYYRNGPGLQVTNPRYRRHTLDGDGMVFSLAFSGGRAYFRNRFVRTQGFVAEQAAGRPLFRNSFTRGAADGSRRFNPFDLRFKNVANTGVLPWAGQLYALWEAGLPYRMDPDSLDTHEETRMGGQIRGNNFSAHYHVLPDQPPSPSGRGDRVAQAWARAQQQEEQRAARQRQGAAQAASQGQGAAEAEAGPKRLVTFSNEFGFGGAKAVFFEFDEAGRLILETEHSLPGVDIAILHDMLVTEHWYGLIVGPITLQPAKFASQYMLGRCSIAECLVFDEAKPTRIMFFPRPGRPSGKALKPVVLEAEPFFAFHNVNAYEREGGQVVVADTVAWDCVNFDLEIYDRDCKRTDGFEGGARAHLTRLTCDLRRGSVRRQKLLQRTVEFPAKDPRVAARPHRVGWFIADAVDDPVLWGPAQSLVRVELPEDPAGEREAAAAERPGAAGSRSLLAPPRRAAGAALGAAAGAAAGVAVDEFYLGDRTFPGEPMFIPKPGSAREGEGWLLVGVHDAGTEKGDVHIFDAEALSAGPLATIHLPHRLPVSLHGAWDPTYRGPDPADAAVPRWSEVGSARPL